MFDRLARITGLILGGIIGWQVAFFVPNVPQNWLAPLFLRWGIPLAALGALLGYWITPYLVTRPARAATGWLGHLPLSQLLAGSIGMALGVLVGALLAIPLSRLPSPFGQILPLVATLILAYLGAVALVLRHRDILELWQGRAKGGAAEWGHMPVLLDTSVIIDGRIADICMTGFLRGPLLVPRFVLNELQYIADASDILRRNRGRRGLEILRELQENGHVELRFLDDDVPEVKQVDEKLIRLAKRFGCPILTNDYNLNRVATLQGVEVLNINDLANAVKTVLLPGETFNLRVIQEGKEPDQGVGYLEDGTMVVVQNGRRHINRHLDVTVTKVLQTSAGRMIFATPARE